MKYYNPDSLEQRSNKPDWKQWLPVYGIHQINKDHSKDKPLIIDQNMFSFSASLAYHAVSTVATISGAVYGLYQLAEKLS